MPCSVAPGRSVPSAGPLRRTSLFLLLAACVACGVGGGSSRPAEQASAPSSSPASAPGDAPARAPAAASPAASEVSSQANREASSQAPDDAPVVVFLGDSLTAGYGLSEPQAFPALLATRLAARGLPFRAVNAGVSGDTSAGGLARLDWALAAHPDVVVVELGPNDGLRGLDLSMTESNLRQIIERIRAAGARVLLVGMRIPPNYGPDYAGRFADLYPRLAAELDVPLVPFLLEGVGGVPKLNQGDGIHPNAAGARIVARNVEPYLEPLVAAAWKQRGGAPGAAQTGSDAARSAPGVAKAAP